MLIYGKAFQDADTHGIPLEIIMIEVHNRGLAVDLDKFYSDALLAGWPAHKAKARICEALQVLRGDHISFTI
jgi:alanyl-tRNA synthetase